METEARPNTPILEIAWARVANLDAAFSRRNVTYYRVRRWIAVLVVLMTLFAIYSQIFFLTSSSLVGLIVRVLLIATPVITVILLAAFASYENVPVLRSAAEQIEKEIYLYRTVHKRNPKRAQLLEKRLGIIQEQLYRSLRGEIHPLDQYHGNLPPYYYPEDPDSDPGFSDLTGEEYFRYRLERMLSWYNRKIPLYKTERSRMAQMILILGIMGSVLAALGGPLSIWVALIGSIMMALLNWQNIRNVEVVLANYSNVVFELTLLYDRWRNLTPEERTDKEFHEMVMACENMLARNRTQQ